MKLSAKKRFKSSVKSQNITDFCWAILEQAAEDFANPEGERTFRDSDVFSIIRQLVILRKDQAVEEQPVEDAELEAWVAKSKQVKKTL